MTFDIDFYCKILTTLINKHDEDGFSREVLVKSVYFRTNVKSQGPINDAINNLVEESEFVKDSNGKITLVVTNLTYFKLNDTLKECCNWTEDDIQSRLDPLFSDSYHKPI